MRSTYGAVWPPGTGPLLPDPWSGSGRRWKLMRHKCQHQSAVVKAFTNGLAAKDWRTEWRQATNEKLISRLARVQARPRDAGFILTQGCALRPTVPNLRA